jgi:hypothetical protein
MSITATKWTTMSSALKEITRSGVVLLAAFLFGASFTVNAAPGVEATVATNPQSGQVQTVYLEYSEVGYSFINQGLPLVTRSTPFVKEPAFAGSKVVRGTFQPGGSASNSIAFIWDRAAGKLYLDLNRNLDLTDDPAGVFGCREKNYSRYYQTFTNVHLPFKTLSGNRELLADLNLYNYGSRPDCTAAVRSFWQGKVILQGADWQVGIVETSFDKSDPRDGGYMLLRPWAERNKPFNTYPGSSDAFPFSRKLFVQNQAYQLDCTNGSQGDGLKLRLQFTGQQLVLGELKITGDFVRRIILQGEPYLVIVDQPEPVVKIPVGRYHQPGVWLKKGDAEAYRDSGPMRSEKWITVDEKKPVVLAAGGPLTNSVSLSRHGKYLRLNYQLLGVDGELYQRTLADRSHPPEFAVYKGDRKIASGKFEFG